MPEVQLYIFPFLKAFLASVALSAGLVFLGRFKKERSRKSPRHIHRRKTIRWGGVAIITSFLVAILLDSNLVIQLPLWGVIFASILILIVGISDDLKELDWRTQLFFQVCIAISVFIMGVQIEYITNPFGGLIFLDVGRYLIPSLFLGIFWILFLMNAVNWLDGLDGLSGGVSFIAVITIFFLSLKPEVNQPPVAIISIALAGALLGFLIFNFHPARIFAGSSGAMFMGFMLAVLSIFAGTKIATLLLVLVIPVFDVVWVIIRRLRSGSSIFEPDRSHLHHKLLEMGWSQKKISLFFYAVTCSVAVIALNTRAIGKLATIILVIIIMTGFFLMMNKKIQGAKVAKSQA